MVTIPTSADKYRIDKAKTNTRAAIHAIIKYINAEAPPKDSQLHTVMLLASDAMYHYDQEAFEFAVAMEELFKGTI